MTYYYPYSRVYLREHISSICRGVVVGGLAVIAWALAIGAATFVINLFN